MVSGQQNTLVARLFQRQRQVVVVNIGFPLRVVVAKQVVVECHDFKVFQLFGQLCTRSGVLVILVIAKTCGLGQPKMAILRLRAGVLRHRLVVDLFTQCQNLNLDSNQNLPFDGYHFGYHFGYRIGYRIGYHAGYHFFGLLLTKEFARILQTQATINPLSDKVKPLRQLHQTASAYEKCIAVQRICPILRGKKRTQHYSRGI